MSGGSGAACSRRARFQPVYHIAQRPDNPWHCAPHASASRLGAEGECSARPFDDVRQAVVPWAQRLRKPTGADGFSLATTLSAAAAAASPPSGAVIAQFLEATSSCPDGGARPRLPRVDRDHDSSSISTRERGVECAAGPAGGSPAQFALDRRSRAVTGRCAARRCGLPRRRLHFIARWSPRGVKASDRYTVNTTRARSDVRPQPTQVSLLRSLC